MNGEKRREQLVQILSKSESPVAGRVLSESLKVSRQVIVQDIALLRANGMQIFSTSRGYYLQSTESLSRVFKVRHTEEEVEEELNLIVDLGGRVEDVFVYHKVYNVVRADLHLIAGFSK
ncbi:MAG: transcription repressor NadR [Lachnospiraceae bacterium]|nr:transcription repressor NadR [Lachnospiraceae bacterium]